MSNVFIPRRANAAAWACKWSWLGAALQAKAASGALSRAGESLTLTDDREWADWLQLLLAASNSRICIYLYGRIIARPFG